MWLIELIPEGADESKARVFAKDHILLGRAESNDLVLNDGRISSLHAQIVVRDGAVFFQDLQSTNGSLVESAGERYVVDGVKFKERRLQDGDRLLLGDAAHPSVIRLRLYEGEANDAPRASDSRTVLASRSISDFSLLSPQILDDKSLVRALFRFQKELHEKDKTQDSYQHSALFLLNHVPSAEYVALHREDPLVPNTWKQVYFTSKIKDIAMEQRCGDSLWQEALGQKRAVLLNADELSGLRRADAKSNPLRSVILAPLIGHDRVIGFLELGNTDEANLLDEGDLDLVSVISYILSARMLNARLLDLLREAEEKLKNENSYLKTQIERKAEPWQLIGESNSMLGIKRQIETVGPSDLSVLILGETGTGKELVARAIHAHSKRKSRIFAGVNCGAFSETLLESELFGHVKGAFTGASDNKKGLFEVADGGTLFLDEIGEIPFHLQVKLLRVLQEGELTPVGAVTPRKVNVRVICATNRDLQKEVEEKRFREDLYYRINTFPILLPPLRERGADIPLLAAHFLSYFQREMQKTGNHFSPACLAALARCPFPGNIRQLKNEVQRALLLAEEDEPVEIYHFSPQIGQRQLSEAKVEALEVNGQTLKNMMEDYEIRVIRSALEENGWNRSKTALKLAISRQALMAKLSKFGLSPRD